MKVRPHRGQNSAGDVVASFSSWLTRWPEHRRSLATAQHALQGQRALHAGLRVAGETVRKTAPPREKGETNTQHRKMSMSEKRPWPGGLSPKLS